MSTLRVIHTSDLHTKLDREGAESLALLRQQSDALLFDSGDAIGATNVTVRAREPVLDLMNLAGYHAMAVGNREFYLRKRGLLHKTAAAEFAVLSANLKAREGELGHLRPWRIFEVGGQRVGVFGITRVMIPPRSWAEVLADVRFIPWREAAAQAVAELRDEVDWLLALSHLGTRREMKLATTHPEIDAILGGHAHDELDERVGPKPTLISHPGHHGSGAAVIEMTHEPDGSTSISRKLVELR